MNASQTPEADWLFEKYIDLNFHFTMAPTISEAEREECTVHFYQFAFDYWLVSRTNQTVAPFQWRRDIRDLFHRLNKPERIADPAAILPFFTDDGKAQLPSLRANLPGVDGLTLTLAKYQDMVKRFDLAFADFYTEFPPDSPPTNGSVFASPKLASYAGPVAKMEIQGARWPRVDLGALGPHKITDSNGDETYEKGDKDTPAEVFLYLTPTAQAYYLPAFLRFCERRPDRSQGVLKTIAKQLTRRSDDAELLRKQLTPKQKEVIVAYYDNWCIHDVSRSTLKDLHRMLTNDDAR